MASPFPCCLNIPAISAYNPSICVLDADKPFPQAFSRFPGRISAEFRIGLRFGRSSSCRVKLKRQFFLKVNANADPVTSGEADSVQNDSFEVGKGDPFAHFRGVVTALPPVVFVMRRHPGANFVVGFCIATAIFVIAGRIFAAKKAMHDRPGSVADLVRRGQLRSDRRGISTPLKYEDPFNNPLVKVGKENSTVEMCGKVYRLAPITLTKEEQAIHQRRRSRAYQWKRPTVFLKEGDMMPPDVDPDTVRWIPANHPFATTASEIDEDLAQTNVYQKHGVPFRIQAEHDALQRKLKALESEEKFDKLMTDRDSASDFERPLKFQAKSQELERGPPFHPPSPAESNSSPEEIQKS